MGKAKLSKEVLESSLTRAIKEAERLLARNTEKLHRKMENISYCDKRIAECMSKLEQAKAAQRTTKELRESKIKQAQNMIVSRAKEGYGTSQLERVVTRLANGGRTFEGRVRLLSDNLQSYKESRQTYEEGKVTLENLVSKYTKKKASLQKRLTFVQKYGKTLDSDIINCAGLERRDCLDFLRGRVSTAKYAGVLEKLTLLCEKAINLEKELS